MKTVHEIVEEYKNRCANPEYSDVWVGFEINKRIYTNVTNLKEVDGWVEFDCKNAGKKMHVKTQFAINHYESFIDE